MRNGLLLLIMSLFITVAGMAQSGQISGKLKDSASSQPMGLATISIFTAADTTLITYRMSANDGSFKIPGLPIGTALRMVVTYSGYGVTRKEFTLTKDESQLDLGAISMAPVSGQTLDEVLVIAERPPVVVKKDTIEFNASAFKTLPTALVEDLLKKLPGVQLDADGNITVNGKRVNRITVDGKDFFGGDPKMATRNLPANLIDKVQVSNDKDEAELNPDKPQGDLGQVINLKLKKAIKQGLFGKAYAGKAEGNGYEAGGILNMFRDTLQVSVLGFSNNLNKAGFGFNDIRSMGGFDRSGISSIWISSGGGLNVNGISFGGMGDGIQTTTGGGINLNNEFKKGLTLNTQYFYGKTRSDISEIENRQQFFGDTILTSRSNRSEVNFTDNHRLGLGLRWKIDTTSRMEFRPSFTLTNNDRNRLTAISTNSNKTGLLNTSNNLTTVDGRDLAYSHSLTYFKSFRKKGRSFNFTNTLSANNNTSDQFSNVQNVFFPTGNSVLDQLRDQDRANFSTTTNLNYTEPINKWLSLRLLYALTVFENKDALATFNKDNSSGKYDQVNALLTNNISRTSWRNTFMPGFNIRHKTLSITASASFLWLDLYNKYITLNQRLNQHYNYVLPSVSASWKDYYVSYSVTVTPPGITDVQPVADNTNPLFINKGNPDLLPAQTHNLNLNFFKNITQKQLSISMYLNGSIVKNGVVRSRTIDANGIQTTTPVNVNDIQSFYSNLYLNKQIKLTNNRFLFFGGGYNINYSKNFVIVNNAKSYVKTLDIAPFVRTGINLNDKFEWNVGYNFSFNNSTYESPSFTDLKVKRNGYNTDVVVRLPKKFVWEMSVNSMYNSQVGAGIQPRVTLMNAGLTYLFLAEDKGQLKFSVYDILNQNRSVSRSTYENYIVDRQVNILQRYFMLTFTYNIRSFGAGNKGAGNKVGGRQSIFFF